MDYLSKAVKDRIITIYRGFRIFFQYLLHPNESVFLCKYPDLCEEIDAQDPNDGPNKKNKQYISKRFLSSPPSPPPPIPLQTLIGSNNKKKILNGFILQDWTYSDPRKSFSLFLNFFEKKI